MSAFTGDARILQQLASPKLMPKCAATSGRAASVPNSRKMSLAVGLFGSMSTTIPAPRISTRRISLPLSGIFFLRQLSGQEHFCSLRAISAMCVRVVNPTGVSALKACKSAASGDMPLSRAVFALGNDIGIREQGLLKRTNWTHS